MKIIGNIDVIDGTSYFPIISKKLENNEFSGIYTVGILKENINKHDILYYNVEQKGWKKAKADNKRTLPAKGMALSSGMIGQKIPILLFGSCQIINERINSELYTAPFKSGEIFNDYQSLLVDNYCQNIGKVSYTEKTDSTSLLSSVDFNFNTIYFKHNDSKNIRNLKVNIDYAMGGEIEYRLIEGTFSRIHAFKSNGEFIIPENGPPEADVLVVAGGGGGGGIIAGGGGAGGLIFKKNYCLYNKSLINVVVGNGGLGGRGWNHSQQNGLPGENSIFDDLIAIGGGGGAHHGGDTSHTDIDGGAGGGGAFGTSGVGGSGIGESRIRRQGHDGGSVDQPGNNAGGGGGHSEPGHDGLNSQYSGDGGAGSYVGDIFGDKYGENGYFSGGGGGGARSGHGPAGVGGIGGGTSGTTFTSKAGNAPANTGGGGGGGGYHSTTNNIVGGHGGSGIVLVRYPLLSRFALGGETEDVVIDGKLYRIHAYKNLGEDVFLIKDIEHIKNEQIDLLVVAGGGGGGGGVGGGGGAGGVLYVPSLNITAETEYNIFVGDGGVGSTSGHRIRTDNDDGQNSSFDELIAFGGGRGGVRTSQSPSDGGSGGGGSTRYGGDLGGSGIEGQGHHGGKGGPHSNQYPGGGGGGAGGPGEDADGNSAPGDGGPGRYLGDIFTDNFGENGWFGGGGGGTDHNRPAGVKGFGGIGGGGNTNFIQGNAQSGLTNTGGGGGAASYFNVYPHSGKGGSGIVLIRYQLGI